LPWCSGRELVEDLAPLVEVAAEELELVDVPAHADTEVDAAVADHVDRHERAGRDQRIVQRQDRDARAEPHVLGDARHVGEQRERVEHHRLGVEHHRLAGVPRRVEVVGERDVLAVPERRVSQPIGEARRLGLVLATDGGVVQSDSHRPETLRDTVAWPSSSSRDVATATCS
jgi:hypothetical protein